MVNCPVKLRSFGSISRVTAALALAACLGSGAYAQEQQKTPTSRRTHTTGQSRTRPMHRLRRPDPFPAL